jgi:5-hydroxyisourate hydrolase
MTGITTHILDTSLGRPATGVGVSLEKLEDDSWLLLAQSSTDADGRCQNLSAKPPAGVYRLTFLIGDYFKQQQRSSIYPEISILFECRDGAHYHLPLLISDNSYMTYRGT